MKQKERNVMKESCTIEEAFEIVVQLMKGLQKENENLKIEIDQLTQLRSDDLEEFTNKTSAIEEERNEWSNY